MPRYKRSEITLGRSKMFARKKKIRVTRAIPIYKRLRGSCNGIYKYKQTARSNALITADTGTAYTAGAFKFTASQIPQWSSLAAIYDQFQIIKVSVMFLPQGQNSDNAYPDLYKIPTFYTVIDYNDAIVPSASTAGIDELLQYDTFKLVQANRRLVRTFTPCIAVQLYQGGVVPGYQAKRRQWVNVDNGTAEHYGLKYVMAPVGNVPAGQYVTIQYQVFITYYINFKSVK